MPANGVVLVRGARPPRRWPSVVVTVMVVFSLSLTGFLFFRDRQNAEAATAARSNAPQDALAMAALSRLAQTLDLDASMRLAGVVGLRAIGLHDFQTLVVGPLGGSVERGPEQWTLALDGGWGCLDVAAGSLATLGMAVGLARRLHRQRAAALDPGRDRRAVHPRRGRSSRQGSAPRSTPPTPPRRSPRPRRAATPRFSMPSLSTRFARLHDTGFRSWATAAGITVATASSSACLQPTAFGAQVRVTVGPCA